MNGNVDDYFESSIHFFTFMKSYMTRIFGTLNVFFFLLLRQIYTRSSNIAFLIFL